MYNSFNTTNNLAERTRFHQQNPSRYCLDKGNPYRRGKCRNPRCSLQCRCNYAQKEAAILTWFLENNKSKYFFYFGMFRVQEDISEHNHRRFRKAFLHQLRAYGSCRQSVVKFLAVSEIGRDGRVHYHYVLYSQNPILHNEIKAMWITACDGNNTIIDHDPPKDIPAAAKYMFKDLADVRQGKRRVEIFEKKTLPITWGTRGFYSPHTKKEIWLLLIREWTGDAFEDRRNQSHPIELAMKQSRQLRSVIRTIGVSRHSRGRRVATCDLAVITRKCPRPPPDDTVAT